MSTPPAVINRRILVVDDNEQIHAGFRRSLAPRKGDADVDALESAIFGDAAPVLAADSPPGDYRIDTALQGEEGFEMVRRAAANDPYALAFVDMRMPPGWDGLKTIGAIWDVDPRVQVVICTAYSDYSWDEIQSRLGRTDRLLILRKPFDRVEVCQLATALCEKWALGRMAALRTEELHGLVRKRTEQLEAALKQDRLRLDLLEAVIEHRTTELRHAATHDRLTGLANRSVISDRLAEAIRRAQADPQWKFAVLFMDLDDFKKINDSFGHTAGDVVLREVARRLGQSLRGVDTVARNTDATAARLGGDEFVVLLENLGDLGDAEKVARRLLCALDHPYDVQGLAVRCGASVGITTSAMAYEQVEHVVRDADIAMYKAKRHGGRCVVYQADMHEQVVQRVTLEEEMRRAMETGQFQLHYQPIVSLTEGTLHSFESLLRWHHPVRGLIPPDRFIPLAEQTGFIRPLGLWTIRQAAAQAAQWRQRYPRTPVSVSVNLSPRQLEDEGLLPAIARILGETAVPPDALVLEVTEGFIGNDSARAEDLLLDLKRLGLRCHIDDFGTGYSALSRLPRLPIAGIKVDRAFVHEARNQRKYAAVINAVVNLAKNMDALVIAEGLESIEQVALLQALDCDLGQGYFFSRPAPPANAERCFQEIHWTFVTKAA